MCAVSAGLNTISLISKEVTVNGVIGLASPKRVESIAGYVDVEPFCRQHGLSHVPVRSYSLRDDGDRELLEGLDIDVLLVAGWQRLVPDWLIRHCRVGAVGCHGSADGITRGRGRSPQNWALLLGKEQFEIALFFLDAGVDSGAVIDSRTFPLGEHDDIRTSYCKASWCVAEMFLEALETGRLLHRDAKSQDDEEAYYLPQRLPEDGAIDWWRSTREICNFVRALTRPYPGAFTPVDGGRLILWAARPFDTGSSPARGTPGEVLAVLAGGELVVATADGALLVDDYTVPASDPELPRQGALLPSTPFSEQLARIIERHRAKYPTLRVAEELERLAAGGRSSPPADG